MTRPAYPDRENSMTLLREWLQHHAAVQELMDGIKTSIGLDPNGPIFNTVWRLFEAYTDTLSVELGDFGGWLSWFYLENDMGAKAMHAGYDGKTRPIKTLAHLYTLIAESRKRMQAQ